MEMELQLNDDKMYILIDMLNLIHFPLINLINNQLADVR